MSKNIFGDNRVETTITAEKTSFKRNAVAFLIGQVNECLNPPENLETYEFKDREVKMFRLRYDNVTGHFQGLYESLGYIMVHGDADEHFVDYGYSKQNSEIPHSFHKKHMQNSFSGTFFSRHKIQHESGAL